LAGIDKFMKFKEWLYTKQNAPDNNPNNAAKSKFLSLRLSIMEYVDELDEMAVPSEEAKEKTIKAFNDEIQELPPEYQKELMSLIRFVTTMTYRSNS
jgi:hypothetical protein